MQLSRQQRKYLGLRKGQNVEQFIWNPRLGQIYEDIDKDNLALGDQGQTFSDFLKMQARPPNTSGTGRYKFSYMKEIKLICIPKTGKPEPCQRIKQNMCQFLNKYLRIPCSLETKIKLEVNQNTLIDTAKQIVYELQSIEGMFDAHEVLSVLMEYHQEKTVLVALMEHQIHEDGVDLDGRAYGDGVAVIYYDSKDINRNIQTYLQTLVHQTLHTVGFDHCLAWKCLMNGYTNFEFWLCPACSKKIYHELQLTCEAEVKTWIRQLLQFSERIKIKKHMKKGYKILNALQRQK